MNAIENLNPFIDNMKQKIQRHDGLIGDNQIKQLHEEMASGHLKRLVFDFSEREPELVISVSDRFDNIVRLLRNQGIRDDAVGLLTKQMALLVWPPVLMMERAHRRQWEDLLPVRLGDNAEGGAE